MRLLNTSTFKLEDFNGHSRQKVSYAILSHCWGNAVKQHECTGSNTYGSTPAVSTKEGALSY
ncbi:Protein of unknown function [Pyronema omphalodes CBS 100304]|uniref:Uncharacterized protein n=1 Tax=Pyronema omphalodes (strain CBS 100304) TaxID=1076935 RepID=U4LCZ4_PYROM|nr:Protein of unknown function [Pyronema omphalodes CBS 100304]